MESDKNIVYLTAVAVLCNIQSQNNSENSILVTLTCELSREKPGIKVNKGEL